MVKLPTAGIRHAFQKKRVRGPGMTWQRESWLCHLTYMNVTTANWSEIGAKGEEHQPNSSPSLWLPSVWAQPEDREQKITEAAGKASFTGMEQIDRRYAHLSLRVTTYHQDSWPSPYLQTSGLLLLSAAHSLWPRNSSQMQNPPCCPSSNSRLHSEIPDPLWTASAHHLAHFSFANAKVWFSTNPLKSILSHCPLVGTTTEGTWLPANPKMVLVIHLQGVQGPWLSYYQSCAFLNQQRALWHRRTSKAPSEATPRAWDQESSELPRECQPYKRDFQTFFFFNANHGFEVHFAWQLSTCILIYTYIYFLLLILICQNLLMVFHSDKFKKKK